MPFADSITALRFPKNISVSKQPHKAFWNRVLVLFVVFKKVLKYELYTPKSNGSYKLTSHLIAFLWIYWKTGIKYGNRKKSLCKK